MRSSKTTQREPPPHPSDDDRRTRRTGVVLLLTAAVFWSLNGVLIKTIHAEGEGPSGVIIAFYRSLFAGLFLLPLARGRMVSLMRTTSEAPRSAPTTAWPWRWRPAAISCVVFYTLMTVSFVVANTQTEAANAIILQYTSTFWIFALSPLLLRESPRRRDVWVLALAILGIAVIFVGNASTSLLGLLNGLSAGAFFALLTMMIRRMRDVDAAALTVANNLGSAVLILPIAIWTGGMFVSPMTWFWLVVIGVVQFGLPYYLYTQGLKRVPAHQAGLITLLEPILVPVWTYLVLSEQLPPATALGGGIILAALLLYGYLARRAR